jgi:hypothetical protein
MARNGKAAEADAKIPDELYDRLKPTEQEVFDLIGSWGFRPDRDEKTLEWYALALQGDKKIGPKPTLSDLAEAVQAAVPDTKDNVVKLKQDHKGNTYFEGMEPIVDEQLAAAALEEFADKEAWNEAGKKKKKSKDALEAIAAAKRHLFRPDPDNSNSLIYRVGGIEISIEKEFKTKVKTRRLEDEDETTVKKAA